VRVIVVDDSWLVRDGIVRLLVDEGVEVLDQLRDASELVATAQATNPDAVVMDVRMPPTFTTEGLTAASELKVATPHIGILLLSQHVETRHAYDLLAHGATGIGYLLKQRITRAGELIAALQRVAAGGTAIDPDVVRAVFAAPRRSDPLAGLTEREREVLGLVSQGLSNERIGEILGVNGRTVETHTSRVFVKLGLELNQETHRRVLAVLAHLRASTDSVGASGP
jgi:DNA-binding NarL/FixJ family response regulator